MEFLMLHQLNIMLFLSGISFVLAILTMLTKALSPVRKYSLVFLEIFTVLLLVFDRWAYIYRGSITTTGYRMVRISNFMVYFLPLCMAFTFTRYICDLTGDDVRLLKRVKICDAIFAVGVILLVVSQFTGLYYNIDAQNLYHRSTFSALAFAFPLVIVLVQLSIIIQFRNRLRHVIWFSLMIYVLVPVTASIIQMHAYGISLVNLSIAVVTALLYIYALVDLNRAVEHARHQEINTYINEQRRHHALFEQTAEALVNAIEAKDSYTNGHSQRVAEYSRKIARVLGKPDEECEEIYFAALLHDVGKIGVPVAILNKNGRLTNEEFSQIKQHPVVGGQILASIQQSPVLSIAARYHHERYDGRGYPEGLKGDDIPEVARIIAVADAYDAMSSNRSYRAAIPQHIVREELVKGSGTQFDPDITKAMLHLLDRDTEYRMRELETGAGVSSEAALRCDRIYHNCTDGVPITDKIVRISLSSQADIDLPDGTPSLILYDSLDGKVHPGQEANKDIMYFEYALIRLDGFVSERGTRKAESRMLSTTDTAESHTGSRDESRYSIEAVRVRDHMLLRILNENQVMQITLALPDNTRFSYLSITGEHCTITRIRVEVDELPVTPDFIPRIAEEISFIKDCPVGNVPNVQVDGWRSDATEGIPLTGDMTLTFHSMSLPTARLVWHCAFISVFTSEDGRVNGPGFREFMLLRLDGENWESDSHVENHVTIDRTADFVGWEEWKTRNKEGLDCQATIRREDNRIYMETDNLGIAISSVTTILDENVAQVFVALTGDQVAITAINTSPL